MDCFIYSRFLIEISVMDYLLYSRFLHLMPDGTVFIVFCFLIRIVSALGSAATSTACLTLLAQEFEDNLSPAVVRSLSSKGHS